ncbi:MAG: L-lactate dehydrogenase [Aggregatilineales bacterium]
MKIGIVGSGFVGASAAFALVMKGIGREIVLVDLDKKRASAEADDIYHAVPFANPLDIRAGDYADLKGSQVVIISAGVSQKPGETRLMLLGRNAAVFRQVIPAILEHAPNAILIIASNPVDIMTHLAVKYAADSGVPSNRVFGSGTTLDTARFRVLLAQHVGVDSRHIHAYVIGEHGDSEVLVWSKVTVGGVPLDDFCRDRGIDFTDAHRAEIDEGVRKAAYRIIDGKGSTYYGIGSALTHLVDIILHDQRSIVTICTPEPEIAGIKDVTVAMPHLLGGDGVIGNHNPIELDEDEQTKLKHSASIIRDLITELEAQENT